MQAFNPGCCCGEGPAPECEILVDDFNRANSGSLGADWTEDAGSWSIDSNELETSSSNAVALAVATNPDGPASYVSAKVKFASTSSTARLIVAATDASNYLYADLLCDGASSILRLYRMTGGTPGLLATFFGSLTVNTATQYDWYLCYSGSTLSTGILGQTLSIGAFGDSGQGVGVGTGTVAGAVNFDDFSATRVSEDCSTCAPPATCTQCCDGGGPFEIVADFTGLSGVDGECENCELLPLEYTLVFSGVSGFPSSCRWNFRDQYCDWPCGISDPHCVDFFLLLVTLFVDDDCKPTLEWRLEGGGGAVDCGCGLASVVATYEGSDGDWEGACDGPVTLTKISETATSVDAACTPMTFPATITISRAA